MKNKYITPFIIVFFTLVATAYLLDLLRYAKEYDGWIIGDWLINFQGGFVRRGLSGYLILAVSDFVNIKPNFIVSSFQMICFLTYMGILFFLMRRKSLNVWFLLMLLSPATLLFPVLDDCVVGRKEVILFFLFAVYILCLEKKLLRSNLVIILFFLALVVATMFHELMLFYTPYFLLAAYIKSRINNEIFNFPKMSFLVLASFVTVILFYMYGKIIDTATICSGLIERGLPSTVCDGILDNRRIYKASYFIREEGYLLSYGFALILSLIPFVIFIVDIKHWVVNLKRFLIAFIFLFLFSLPLFILAVDWGRWINIHFVLLLFTSTLLLKDKSVIVKDGSSADYISIPRLWKSDNALLKISGNVVFAILCFSYITFWSMRHYSEFRLINLNFYNKIDYIFHQLIN